MKVIKFKGIHTILIILLAMVIPVKTYAQSKLNINDRLPALPINNQLGIVNDPVTTTQLYKKGMLILNFWATWCAPCIKEMQMMAELQKKQKDRFQVICISHEKQGTVNAFLEKNPAIKNSGLRIISADTVFSKMFFHQALPHNVWVNQQGVIKAITGDDEVSEKNIINFLTGSNNGMKVKQELPFDSNKAIHIPDSLLTFRSIFYNRLPGVEMSGTRISTSMLGWPNANRFMVYNLRILTILWTAWQMPGNVDRDYLYEVHTRDSSRYFWPGEGKDPLKYTGPSMSKWVLNNTYTYEFRIPEAIADSLFFPKVIHDLEFYLKVKSSRVLKARDCYVVSYQTGYAPKEPAPVIPGKAINVVKNQLIISAVPVDFLLDWLGRYTYKSKLLTRKEPYLNKTGINFPISAAIDLGNDITLHRSRDHIEKCLSEQLKLKFELKKAMYRVLVIRDN